jgi:hypothetical protein
MESFVFPHTFVNNLAAHLQDGEALLNWRVGNEQRFYSWDIIAYF